ncbi:MAG TPA: TonB family protein [Steroidobacteraceae bacterium]|jgi:TonB family protein
MFSGSIKWSNAFRCTFLLAAMQVPFIPSATAEDPTPLIQPPPPLPKLKSVKPFSYPDKAKLRDLEGSVLAEFSIDASGRTRGVSLLRADNPLFAATAKQAFSGFTYELPAGWSQADSAVRFRMVMVFCLPPSNQTTTFAESPYEPVIVSGSRIGRAGVKTIPGTCKAAQ